MPLTAWRVSDEVIVMAKSTNRKRRSAVSPAPDRSSLKAAELDRSANVTECNIAHRAYELYLARGCEDGHDVDDWLLNRYSAKERKN
jgi:hypothetical protein